jgi:hypothetical protein
LKVKKFPGPLLNWQVAMPKERQTNRADVKDLIVTEQKMKLG